MCQDTCEPICFKLGMMLNTPTVGELTLNFLEAVVNSLHTMTHSSKEKDEFSFESAVV